MRSETLAELAARRYCEGRLLDYRRAIREALDTSPGSSTAPDPLAVEAAVIRHQQRFGGEAYRRRLRQLRETALAAMQRFADFTPRLVGAVANGALHEAHRVQLHLFSDPGEAVDLHCAALGISFVLDERRYRYADGHEARIPLLRFEAGEVGIDLAVFDLGGLRHPPLSPVSGRTVKRLTRTQVQALLDDSTTP